MVYDPLSLAVFAIIVIGLLILDLKVVGRKSHEITTKEAGIWTAIFVGVSLLYAGFLYYEQGSVKSMEFLTAYAIEKTLSVDNLFVFILVFKYFAVPKAYHHKVLFWGIMGAIVLRAVFIFAGVGLIEKTYITIGGLQINAVIVVFGLFLIYSGVKSAIGLIKGDSDDDEDFSDSPGAKFIKWAFRGKVTKEYDGDKFFTKQLVSEGVSGSPIDIYVKYATPLLVVVGVVEFTDLLFAVDSIPAIFSVSKDPIILYTSNIFAILGLRSMYFLLANMLPLFRFLNHGLAFILAFIGTKMVIAPFYHIEGSHSLYVVLAVLTLSIIVSLLNPEKNVEEQDTN